MLLGSEELASESAAGVSICQNNVFIVCTFVARGVVRNLPSEAAGAAVVLRPLPLKLLNDGLDLGSEGLL